MMFYCFGRFMVSSFLTQITQLLKIEILSDCSRYLCLVEHFVHALGISFITLSPWRLEGFSLILQKDYAMNSENLSDTSTETAEVLYKFIPINLSLLIFILTLKILGYKYFFLNTASYIYASLTNYTFWQLLCAKTILLHDINRHVPFLC